MSFETQKLKSMYQQNKISEQDYQLLSKALTDKNNSEILSILINPFQKIAGAKALLFGLITIVLVSLIGTYAKVYFLEVGDCLNAANLKHSDISPPYFMMLLKQNLVNWLTLASLFTGFAYLFKQKGTRIIDIYGTVALALFPYLILTSFIAMIWVVEPKLLDFDVQNITIKDSFHILGMLSGTFWQFCFAWLISTYFFALKESTGLKGNKLWLTFIISLLIASPLSYSINAYIL